MSYKEFLRWCNDRSHDGRWGLLEAVICLDVFKKIQALPFWKRKQRWRELEQDIVSEIIEPTNAKIRELLGVEK